MKGSSFRVPVKCFNGLKLTVETVKLSGTTINWNHVEISQSHTSDSRKLLRMNYTQVPPMHIFSESPFKNLLSCRPRLRLLSFWLECRLVPTASALFLTTGFNCSASYKRWKRVSIRLEIMNPVLRCRSSSNCRVTLGRNKSLGILETLESFWWCTCDGWAPLVRSHCQHCVWTCARVAL